MSHIIEVPVSLDQSYEIQVGTGLWNSIRSYLDDHFPSRLCVVVVDEKVNRLHGEKIQNQMNAVFERVEFYKVPEGEKSKNSEEWNKLVNFMLKQEVERATPVIAAGGGVTGDLAGFAASAVLRGIPLVHLPTSLLAMVDSSIGGKTGINHRQGKNLIGSFYQPEAVFTDLEFLNTLDENEWINGLSEILKYAAIEDPSMFNELEAITRNKGAFEPDEQWLSLIVKSAGIKSQIVSMDTLEAGSRAYLNFGHTFGHALEKLSGFGTISHGEAVFAGMIAAVRASERLGHDISHKRFDVFKPLYSLNLDAYQGRIDELVETMYTDKKVQDDQIRLILLRDWGDPFVRECRDVNLLKEAWSFALSWFS